MTTVFGADSQRKNQKAEEVQKILEERAGSEEAAAPDQSELTHMMRELEQLKGQMKMMVQLMTAMVSSRGIEPTKLLPQVQQHKE